MDRLFKNALDHARADYVEIRVEERTTTRITYVGQELEDISDFTSLGGCIRALSRGGWGFVSFNDIEDLPRYVRLACQQAAMVGRTESRLAAVPAVADSVAASVGVDPRQVPLAHKEELCRRYNQQILSHARIQTSSVRYRDTFVRTAFATSEGADLQQEALFCGISLVAIAKDGANIQNGVKGVGDLRGFQIVEHREADCEEVAERAVALLAAQPVKGGRYAVIVDPLLGGVFAHEAFGHLSEADVVYENPRLLAKMQLGSPIGGKDLSIVDDPTLPNEAGSYRYDSEGTPGRRTYLIENGVLTCRLHSRETAAKMGEPVTGNARALSHEFPPIVRMSNTYIEPRQWAFGDLVADTGEGIYARGSLGGQTDCEMFTFSAEEAFLIRDGRLGERVREVVLTGNVFETLAYIDAIGNDLALYGGLEGCGKADQCPLRVSTGSPHFRIRECLIGGRSS